MKFKHPSNKLSHLALLVLRLLIHPRRFRVTRENQIAVITLLDVNTALPRCPSFVKGIRNILPMLLAFLFWGGKENLSGSCWDRGGDRGRNSLPVWTSNKHSTQCHPKLPDGVDGSSSPKVTFWLGKAVNFMLSSYLWLGVEGTHGFDIYTPNLMFIGCPKKSTVAWKCIMMPFFSHTVWFPARICSQNT